MDRTPYYYFAVPHVDTALAERLGIQSGDDEALWRALDVDVRYVTPRLIQAPGEERYGYECGAVHARVHNTAGGEEEIAFHGLAELPHPTVRLLATCASVARRDTRNASRGPGCLSSPRQSKSHRSSSAPTLRRVPVLSRYSQRLPGATPTSAKHTSL